MFENVIVAPLTTAGVCCPECGAGAAPGDIDWELGAVLVDCDGDITWEGDIGSGECQGCGKILQHPNNAIYAAERQRVAEYHRAEYDENLAFDDDDGDVSDDGTDGGDRDDESSGSLN